MKQISKFMILMIVAGYSVSCGDVVDFPVDTFIEEVSDGNSVSPNVVNTYIKAIKKIPATKASLTEVTPVLNEGDTVMYLVNYPEGGWELLSADKRIPTRLMVGEEGSMSLSEIENHPGMSILLEEMRQKIYAVRQNGQEEPVTDVGILWDKIDPSQTSTKAGNINWVLYDSETVYFDSTDVRHLTRTHWNQTSANGKWYNRYVPFVNSQKLNTSEGRCAVGCVPLAIGQMLSYLYGKIQITNTCTFSECQCNTFIPDGSTSTSYGQYFIPNVSTNMSYDQYWRSVGTGNTVDQQKCIGVLLSYLGYLLDAEYFCYYDAYSSTYIKFTGATDTNIQYILNHYYGINCNRTSWNSSIVKNQITENKMPVLIFANDATGAVAHAWIIDGYYCMNSVINYYYVGFEQPSTSEPIYKTEQVVGVNEEYFTMNWGEGGVGDTGTYYVDSSNWSIYPGVQTVNLNKKIIYGFTD